MPIEIEDLLKDERTITVEIGGQEGQVVYRPSAMTPELEMMLNRTSAVEGVSTVLSELLIDWDVTINGEKAPFDYDTLIELPSDVVAGVFRAINDDMADRREERKNSGAGSPREASKAKRRGGSTFSKPPRR